MLKVEACKVEPISCNLSFSFWVAVKLEFKVEFVFVKTSFFAVKSLFSACAFVRSAKRLVTLPLKSVIKVLASASQIKNISYNSWRPERAFLFLDIWKVY